MQASPCSNAWSGAPTDCNLSTSRACSVSGRGGHVRQAQQPAIRRSYSVIVMVIQARSANIPNYARSNRSQGRSGSCRPYETSKPLQPATIKSGELVTLPIQLQFGRSTDALVIPATCNTNNQRLPATCNHSKAAGHSVAAPISKTTRCSSLLHKAFACSSCDQHLLSTTFHCIGIRNTQNQKHNEGHTNTAQQEQNFCQTLPGKRLPLMARVRKPHSAHSKWLTNSRLNGMPYALNNLCAGST